MKFKVIKHHIINGWVISGTKYYLTRNPDCKSIYYDLHKEVLVDSLEIIKEKFNVFQDSPFIFRTEEDAKRFLEYLEPFIIMEELTK